MAEDRAVVERHLAQAEAAIKEGTRHVQRQREIVASLQVDGHNPRQAEELLAIFEETLASHIEGRNRLRKELDEARDAASPRTRSRQELASSD